MGYYILDCYGFLIYVPNGDPLLDFLLQSGATLTECDNEKLDLEVKIAPSTAQTTFTKVSYQDSASPAGNLDLWSR